MWQFTKLLAIFALVISTEAIPKKYHGIQKEVLKSVKKEQIKLPESIVPSKYQLNLKVTQENLEHGNFTGDVTITVDLNENMTRIPMHGKDITISSVKVAGVDADFQNLDENDFFYITKKKESDQTFQNGTYEINIVYSGKLSDTDMQGFYRSSYKNADNNQTYLAATQFEQMGARRAFPCFDEPHLKATFDITITYPTGYNAISNTPIKPSTRKVQADTETEIVTFETTPVMSTYLVAFLVSDFNCTQGEPSDSTTTEICAKPNSKFELAKNTAPKVLDVMANITGLKFESIEGIENPKLSQAAIPDFAPGAMENWGLVTYREAALLSDDTESSNADKQKIVTVIAHELSHQWFGDYITLKSWDDIFLNEGFATYFEYFAAAKLINISDTWELDKQFIIEQLQPVLLTDSSDKSQPLHVESNDPNVIESRFDDIAYNKGGTILRMVYHIVGDVNFKNGLANYLTKGGDHRTVTPEDLWSSFKEFLPNDVPANLSTMMHNWVYNSGYPLLTVTLTETNLTITQEDFKLSANSTTNNKWYVPVTYTSDKDNDSSVTSTQMWLTPDKDIEMNIKDLKNLTWILLNNQQVGYYRVKYDSKLLKSIKSLLDNNIGLIDEIKRSQLVDDQMNLARADKITLNDALDFITFLEKDNSYYSWYSAFNGLSYLLKRTSTDKVKTALTKYTTKLMTNLLKSVPLKTANLGDQIYTLKQVMAHTWACKLGVSDCVSFATTQFDAFKNETSSQPVNANFRSFVYCTALANSKNASNDFDFLYNKYQTADLATVKVTILKSLGCLKDKDVRQEYMVKALIENEIRIQDVRYVFESIYTHDGVDDIIDFITNNYTLFENKFGDQSQLLSLIATVGDYITRKDQIDKLTTFATNLNDPIKTAVTAATSAATENLKITEKLENSLTKYFSDDGDNNSASISGFSFVNLALILMASLMFTYY